jgi:hypothetical protein
MSMKPVVGRLEEEFQGRVEFRALNIDDADTIDAQQKYRFIGQPQFVILDQRGEILATHNGVVSYEKLKADVERALQGRE